MSPWHDTDPFWMDFYEVMFHQRRWDQADEEADGLIALTGLEKGGRILDMCCGPGRHALAMAKRGYAVTGVDRTVAYVEEARRRARDADLDASFEVGDAREYRELDQFDGATCLYTSFGYFETPEEDMSLLRNLCLSLKSGGCLVIDMHGKEISARAYKDRTWDTMEDGSLLLESRTVGPAWAWIENTWTVVKDGQQKQATFRVRMYSGTELKTALEAAGFKSTELYGDWSGAPYDEQARRLIAVARK